MMIQRKRHARSSYESIVAADFRCNIVGGNNADDLVRTKEESRFSDNRKMILTAVPFSMHWVFTDSGLPVLYS